MTNVDKIPPRDRIFNAAVSLFAQKGYSAVGVRELATEAGVNISMISYYFGGKIGLLKDIIEQFYNEYSEIIKNSLDNRLPLKEQTKQTIRSIVNFFKSRPDLCRIGITELPYDSPEIAEFKSEKVLAVKELIFDRLFSNFSLIIDDKITISIISPALISVIYSNFLLGDVIRNVTGVEFDDAFYERYSETISTFLIGGIMAVAAELQNKKGSSLF